MSPRARAPQRWIGSVGAVGGADADGSPAPRCRCRGVASKHAGRQPGGRTARGHHCPVRVCDRRMHRAVAAHRAMDTSRPNRSLPNTRTGGFYLAIVRQRMPIAASPLYTSGRQVRRSRVAARAPYNADERSHESQPRKDARQHQHAGNHLIERRQRPRLCGVPLRTGDQ